MSTSHVRFPLGTVVVSPHALKCLTAHDVNTAIDRHRVGDWGDVGEEDWQANEESLGYGGRLVSAYRSSNGTTFWIITEADRGSTCLLLPEEY